MENITVCLETTLSKIGTARLAYDTSEAYIYQEDYDFVWNYATERQLFNTLLALPTVRALHSGMYRGTVTLGSGTTVRRPYICHCLSVCKLLIHLHLDLTNHEKDLVLAAALCHDVPAFVSEMRHTNGLTDIFCLDQAVTDLVEMIYTRDCVTDEDFDALFEKVSANKLAALVKLADRGNVIEQLCSVSAWRAAEYIHETRTYYLPLCIKIREDYPELDRALGIVQEKLRDLTEATEIFSARYIDMENELTLKILQLTDDNSRMRMQIRRQQAEGQL